jgi:hypothetical protein
LADEEDYDEEDSDYDEFRDYVPYEDDEDEERSNKGLSFRDNFLPMVFGILALFLAFGWMMLVYLTHLPSYLDVFSIPLFFFGWMGVPLILGWWHER